HHQSILFPYTTLFRSKILGLNLPIVTVIYARIGVVSRIISIRIFRCPIVKLVFVYRSKLQDVRKIYGVVEPKVSFSDTSQEQGKDRKSTRLNSSHVKI